MKSEIITLTHAVKEALWLHQLCHDLHIFDNPESPTTPSILMINLNSENVLKAIKNPVFHIHTKHFDMRHHFIRDVVAKGELSVDYITGDENPADIFTKSLDRNKHAVALGLILSGCNGSHRVAPGYSYMCWRPVGPMWIHVMDLMWIVGYS